MPGKILLISRNRQDVLFAKHLADMMRGTAESALDRAQVRRALALNPRTIVLWDAETTQGYEAIQEILPKYVRARRVIALTDKPFDRYRHLLQTQVAHHHIMRRFQDPMPAIAARLCTLIHGGKPATLQSYFPPTVPIRKITISRAAHKKAATEAIQGYLTKQGIRGRQAALIAQAIDELVMNAILHGPARDKDDGDAVVPDWSTDFELPGKQQIEVELAADEGLLAACVTDHFGSLRALDIMAALSLQRGSKIDDGGLGLGGTYQAGLSLGFEIEPSHATRATVFSPRAESFKDFRGGFRFFSIQSHD